MTWIITIEKHLLVFIGIEIEFIFRGPEFIDSVVASRLNGYIAGYGTKVNIDYLIYK